MIILIIISTIMIVGYFPTILELTKHKKMKASITSYTLWSTANFIGCYYSYFIVSDIFYKTVFTLHFILCLSIVILSIMLKNKLFLFNETIKENKQKNYVKNYSPIS
ncbi:hypothetical protein CL658_03985 [bacterium]|nr:hypothetical protein [bacterium]